MVDLCHLPVGILPPNAILLLFGALALCLCEYVSSPCRPFCNRGELSISKGGARGTGRVFSLLLKTSNFQLRAGKFALQLFLLKSERVSARNVLTRSGTQANGAGLSVRRGCRAFLLTPRPCLILTNATPH